MELNILAAGATESIIRDMVGTFERESGHTVKLPYAPVGALRDKIYAGYERTPHPEAAQAFLSFLMSPQVQARFKQAGYEPAR